jgi:pyruvate,water dikinase
MADSGLTTGLPGLDQVLKGILPGDNIVWQIDGIEEYKAVVQPYARAAIANGKTLVYFRFARHEPLLEGGNGIQVQELDPQEGFENFIAAIHAVIEKAGRGAFYVFDCLSKLAVDWYSDQMLANFFMLTCPYLYDLETVTYFALFRNFHTSHALLPIQQTTQLFLDTYRHRGAFYIRPVKVQQRHSPTMGLLHVWQGDTFKPVTASAVIAEILTSAKWSGLSADSSVGFWETSFIRARELLRSGEYRADLPGHGKDLYEQLLNMIISRDAGMQQLLTRYFSLQDILDVRKRLIGTGLIGGKAVGMLLARAIVKRTDARLAERMEEHDSFFVGSDVFYDFLVRNGIWWIRQKQRNPNTFLEDAEQARRRILTGEFPRHIVSQLEETLDYFGQSPFIVRSSSLLEDNYGNAFAGKYESVFCVNQGPRERRLQDLLVAIKTIYASSMSERALTYRARRGMLDKDEQMALLIMRVSGQLSGHMFFPHLAGVGYSFNPYAWAPEIDPKAGVVRLVFGLGTRAVDRADDDYTRIIALNAPEKRPESTFDEIAKYAQRRVDHLDLEANQLVSGPFSRLLENLGDIPITLFAAQDREADGQAASWILTFDGLMRDTPVVNDLRQMLRILHAAYEHPVDIEFTINFLDPAAYKINLLQCRPLQFEGTDIARLPSVRPSPDAIILEARAAVVGQSRFENLAGIVFIVPELYAHLPLQHRYEIARLLGQINRALPDNGGKWMLIGPGRWGTTNPHLGVPVIFNEISRASVLCEMVAMHAHLIPDVSLGTHFFSDLVENNMLYIALDPHHEHNHIETAFFQRMPNQLTTLVPSAEPWSHVVQVVRSDALGDAGCVRLWADAMEQRVLCYVDRSNRNGDAPFPV